MAKKERTKTDKTKTEVTLEDLHAAQTVPQAQAETETTVDPKAAKKAKNQAKRKAKKSMLITVLNYVKETCTDPEILKAAKILTPGNRAETTTRQSAISDVFDGQETGFSVHEDHFYNEFKLGRGEMRKATRNFIKKAKAPEDRLWVSFNPVDGMYTLEGVGADAPEGWTGYVPVTIEDMEI